MKIRFRDRLINVVRSLYSETLILRLKATLCVVDLRGTQLRSSHKLVPFSEQSRKTRQWNARVSRWELADWKTSLKFITKTKRNQQRILIFFLSSKCVKIARLAIQRNPINPFMTEAESMDWFLYDIGLRHERVN